MKYYFQLQFNMLNRQLRDFGIHPVPGYLLAVAAFSGISILLFKRISFAPVVYVALAFTQLVKLSERNRNLFLQTCFPMAQYRRLRLVENILAATPFVLFLICKLSFIPILVLLVLAGVMAFIQVVNKWSVVLPTPFYKYPFEFVTGFRKSWWLFGLCYLLTGIAIAVDNFNLGIFSLAAVLLICLSFYATAEDPFYVWVFAKNPKAFLLHKIKIALLYAATLCVPVALALGIFYIANIWIIAGVCLLGCLYLINIILAKYAAFPGNMHLPQALLLGLSILLPPLLFVTLPLFYFQSLKKLNTVLP